MATGKTTQVTKISSSSRTVTQTFSSVQGRIGLQQSFEEISSPSRQLFLENASLRMSPGWVSGHGSLFESPKSSSSPSPIKPAKTRRSSVYVKKSSVATSSVDSFKKPPVFISPTGVKTRARRSSIYQKSGKNLLSGLDHKARRDSLAAIRSKKLVSESDYVFAVPTADSAKRKKLVSKSSRTKKAAEPKTPPKRTSSKSQAKSPVKKSVRTIHLVNSKSSNKSNQQNIKVIAAKKKSSPKKEKTVRSKTKAKTPVKEVELADDDDDSDDDDDDIEEDDILSPRRTRKTPGKSRKRSLSTVTKSAKKRKRSPSRSPSPAKKKKSPSPKKKISPKKSSSKTKRSSTSSKQRKSTIDSPNTSASNSLEISLTPLEVDESFTPKLSDSDRKKLAKKSKVSSKSTPQKSTKSTTKKTPKSSAKKSTAKTPKSSAKKSTTKTPKSSSKKSTKKTPKSSAKKSTTKTPKSSAKKSTTKKTPSSTKRISLSSKEDLFKSLEKKLTRKPIGNTTDKVAKVLEFEPTETFDSQNGNTGTEVEEDISTATNQTSVKSKTPLTTQKMKSILDSVSEQNGTDKKRKTTDFVEPQSANKRRRFDMEKFEKIVASTPRDMRLDILSGRRPELSPIPGNKTINNSFSTSKQVTIFSDKSTFLSAGPSNLSPVACKSPLIVSEVVEDGVNTDLIDGNDDDLDYSHISISQKPADPEPYLYDYDSDLDISHSNVQAGCTIL